MRANPRRAVTLIALATLAASCAAGEEPGGAGGGEAPKIAEGAPGVIEETDFEALESPVEEALAKAPWVRAIVNLRVLPGESLADVQRDVSAAAGPELSTLHAYSHVPAIAGEISLEGLARLRAHPSVASVQIDEAGGGHLAQSVPLLAANTVQSFGVNGQGVRAAVLDSGVDVTHPDLSDDLIAQQCYTSGACPPGNTNTGTSAQDNNGHGTNVAGILTAKGVVSAVGFAPATKIAAVRVLDQNNSGFVSDWVAGLNWVIANQATLQVRIVNMSLGTFALYTGTCDASQPALASAVSQLVGLGVAVFASTGNQGSSTAIAAPACNTGVIAVGATYDANLGRQPASGTYQNLFGGNWPSCFDASATPSLITCFTNSSSAMDLVGPGASLTTSWLNGGLGTYTGTSQASPTAAAIAALMLQCNPKLTPAQIESTLKQTGTPIVDSKNGLTFRSIHALAAVTAACPCLGQANGSACNDGDGCTQTDACQSNVCVGQNPVVCAALDQCHVAGTCSPATGACSNPNKPNGASCNDGDACTQVDACQSGVCAGASPVVCTALDQCYDAGVCDPMTGVCSAPNKADGAGCNDGDACTLVDTCQSGVCAGGSPVVCSALDQCHDAGMCDPMTGVCSDPVKADGAGCNDGDACTLMDTCQSGACAAGSPVVCTAQDQCHDAGTCSAETGICSNPAKADGAGCDDGSACTQVDTCQSGVCTGQSAVVCTAQDPCHLAGACDAATGACSNPLAPDGTACPEGQCESGACVPVQTGTGGTGGETGGGGKSTGGATGGTGGETGGGGTSTVTGGGGSTATSTGAAGSTETTGGSSVSRSPGDCGCRTDAGDSAPRGGASLLALAAALLLRRRRNGRARG